MTSKLLTLVLAGSVFASIGRGSSEPIIARPIAHDATEVVYDEPGDGALYAVGHDWKACFANDAVSFVPFLGSDAPRDEVVRFALASVSVDGALLELDLTAMPVRDGDTIRYARGSVDELFEARAEGLEHSFVLETLPLRGEIVVRCAIDTQLAVRECGDAIEFSNERGGVRYSGAIAFDAAGRRCALRSRLEDGSITIALPAAWTRDAALPVTIDPLISVFGVAIGTPDEISPDVSVQLASGGEWRCEVWETVWSQTDRDVTARLTRVADGAVTLFPIDATTEYWSAPKVASIIDNKLASEFGIVSAVGLPTSGAREIRSRLIRVSFQPPQLFAPVVLSAGVAGDSYSPDIGGDPYSGGSASGSNFFAVWQRDQPGGDSDVFGTNVFFPQPFALAADPLLDDEDPRVSKADGTVEWGVVWTRRVSPTNRDVYARRVSWDFAQITPEVALSTAPEDEVHPAISSGFGYVVVYERDMGGQHDIMLQPFSTTVHPPLNLTLLEGGSHAPLHQFLPAIDGGALGYLVSYKENDPGVPGGVRTRLTSLTATFAGVVTLHETHVPLGAASSGRAEAWVCSVEASMGGTVPRFVIVWDAPDFGGISDVYGAIFVDGATTGTVVASCFGDGSDTNCPCGNNGGAPAGCPNSLHANGAELLWTGQVRTSADNFVVHATRLPPNSTAVLAQGTVFQSPAVLYGDGVRCVAGTQVRIATRTADANGEIVYPVIGTDPSISSAGGVAPGGGARTYQLVYRNSAPFCTSETWNTTNALLTTWAP